MKELLDMFLTFARIGGFTFGGGYVIVTLMKKKFVIRIGEFQGRLRRHWESLRRRLSSL